jgi:hypothetical protein
MRASTVGCRVLDRCGDSLGLAQSPLVRQEAAWRLPKMQPILACLVVTSASAFVAHAPRCATSQAPRSASAKAVLSGLPDADEPLISSDEKSTFRKEINVAEEALATANIALQTAITNLATNDTDSDLQAVVAAATSSLDDATVEAMAAAAAIVAALQASVAATSDAELKVITEGLAKKSKLLDQYIRDEISDRKAVTVVSTSRPLGLGTQETKAETETEQDPLAISAKDDMFPVCCSPLLPPPLRRARLSRRGVGHPDQSLVPASHSRVESGKCGLRRRMESCSRTTWRR